MRVMISDSGMGCLTGMVRRAPTSLPSAEIDPMVNNPEDRGLDTSYTSSAAYSIDGSSEIPFLIFSKIAVFQLSSFMTWSYSTTALVNAS